MKADRASMASGLELRTPFLDHRLVEFSWTLPVGFKIRSTRESHGEKYGDKYGEKWLLRGVLDRYVPAALTERPKRGFSVPLAEWLRGPLRDWAETLLEEKALSEDGYLNAKYIRAVWNDHLGGKRNHEAHIWSILMFQQWLLKEKAGEPPTAQAD